MNLCCNNGMDKLIEFFQQLGIKSEKVNFDEYGFSRTIRFFANGEEYDIVWFINECTLIFKGIRAHFRYILKDTTYPIDANIILRFQYDETNKWSDIRLIIK